MSKPNLPGHRRPQAVITDREVSSDGFSFVLHAPKKVADRLFNAAKRTRKRKSDSSN
jgi:hypothetical protein